MTKRKREEDEHPKVQLLDAGPDRPLTTTPGGGATQTGSLPAELPVLENMSTNCTEAAFTATSSSYVAKNPSWDEGETETTSAALEGDFGPSGLYSPGPGTPYGDHHCGSTRGWAQREGP